MAATPCHGNGTPLALAANHVQAAATLGASSESRCHMLSARDETCRLAGTPAIA